MKLADLGEARSIHGPPKNKLPPIPARNWAAPELLEPGAKAEVYTMKSEVYGLGIVFCELLTLKLPYGDAPDMMTQTEWYRKLVSEHVIPELPPNIDEDLSNCIEKSLSIDPLSRPSSKDVYSLVQSVLKREASST